VTGERKYGGPVFPGPVRVVRVGAELCGKWSLDLAEAHGLGFARTRLAALVRSLRALILATLAVVGTHG